MNPNNPLTDSFLIQHPLEAAHVLEMLPLESAAAFLAAIVAERAAPVLRKMDPDTAARCLAYMDEKAVMALTDVLPESYLAHLLRTLDRQQTHALLALLPAARRVKINRQLRFPGDTVGAVMNTRVFSLPMDITAGDAIRRVKARKEHGVCDLYVVDNDLRLSGIVSLDSLLKAEHHIPLRTLLSHPPTSLSAFTTLTSVCNHRAWSQHCCLPVVNKGGALAGMLEFSAVQRQLADADKTETSNALAVQQPVIELGWLALAEAVTTICDCLLPAHGEKAKDRT